MSPHNSRQPYKQKRRCPSRCLWHIKYLNGSSLTEVSLENAAANKELGAAFVEGAILSSYQFLKYKTKESKGQYAGRN
jgi:hypothetical protein